MERAVEDGWRTKMGRLGSSGWEGGAAGEVRQLGRNRGKEFKDEPAQGSFHQDPEVVVDRAM